MDGYIQKEFKDIEKRVRCMPIPLEISLPVMNIFKNWCESNGIEWSIQRMKAVKVDLIRVAAGQPAVSTWIKKSRKPGRVFAGPIGALESWMSISEKNWRIGIQLLMMYSWFVAEEVTPKQHQKFIKALSADREPLPDWIKTRLVERIYRTGYEWKVSCDNLPKPLIDMVPRPNRFAPTPTVPGGRGYETVPETSGAIVDSVLYLTSWSKGRQMIEEWFPLFEGLFKGMESFVDVQLSGGVDVISDFLPMGRISFLQEPGYKLRYIANPARVYQRLLEPLGDVLFGLAKSLPWDCTFDQMKGIPSIQAHLAKGQPAYSFDLSSATDFFPLELQERVLTSLVHDPHRFIPLWVELSRSDWFVNGFQEGDHLTFLKWKKGQPLGLYPSFAAFALSHGFLLLSLLDSPYQGQFFILGDDVIILDEGLAKLYQAVMEELGCPISYEKSIQGMVAEFAGKIITPTAVIPQLKWRRPSDDNFVDLARLLGPSSLPLFKKRQREVLNLISEVPEFLGGLGWNPRGKPIEDRIPRWAWDFEQTVKEFATSQSAWRNKNWYSSWISSFKPTYVGPEGETSALSSSVVTTVIADHLEQRVTKEVISLLGAHLAPLSKVLGKNLAKVAQDLGIELKLPISVNGRPSTQLEHWQTILKIA